jgi:hypothetical protein
MLTMDIVVALVSGIFKLFAVFIRGMFSIVTSLIRAASR